MMPSRRLDVVYRLRFPRPTRLFCGAGTGTAMADRTYARDERRRPFIPGSHLKGIVRNHCERLLRLTGAAVSDPHDHGAIGGDEGLVAALFGRPGAADISCVFGDATLSGPATSEVVDQVLDRVRMDRRLGRPADRSLFNTEYAVLDPDQWMEAKVTLWVDEDAPRIPPELTLLCAGLRLVDSVGGDTSTGAGALEVEVVSATSGSETLGLAEILAPLKAVDWPVAEVR